jgi:riboflavin kinase/FMN adenylyltransferase
MRVVRHLTHLRPTARPRVVAAGRFDGVHLGHQAVLTEVVARAAALAGESLLVLERPPKTDARLLSPRQLFGLLDDIGIETILLARKDDMAPALQRIDATVIVMADADTSTARAETVANIAPVLHAGARIDAERIAAALARGDLKDARAMLGRDPGVVGRVVHGFHRGAPLGIPTANLRVRGLRLPADGVYAVQARVGDQSLRGVANIGFNPTFGNQSRSVETHILDFTGDLYGQRLELSFLSRLRGERKFPDVTALLAQIRSDIETARRYFAEHRG